MSVRKSQYLKGLQNANKVIVAESISVNKSGKLHDQVDKVQFRALYLSQNKKMPVARRLRSKSLHDYFRGQAMAYGYYSKTGKLLKVNE